MKFIQLGYDENWAFASCPHKAQCHIVYGDAIDDWDHLDHIKVNLVTKTVRGLLHIQTIAVVDD